MLLCHSGQPLGLCLPAPNLHKKDKKAGLVLPPIAPHWKHPLTPLHLLFHSAAVHYHPPFLEQCMHLLGRTTGGNFECYCTRYEEAACIKAAMTPFWSSPPLSPPPTHPPSSPVVCPARCKPVTHCLACINPGAGARNNVLSLLIIQVFGYTCIFCVYLCDWVGRISD